MVVERCADQAQSLCDPVLGDAKAVHAKYLEVDVQLCRGLKIGYVCAHCSSRTANGFFRGIEQRVCPI